MGPTQMPIPAAAPTRSLGSRHCQDTCVEIDDGIEPSQGHGGDGGSEAGDCSAGSVEQGAETTRAFATVAVHRKVGGETAQKAADGETGGDKGEGRVRHRDAGGETMGRDRKCVLACEDGLELVQSGNVVSVLEKDGAKTEATKKELAWKESPTIQTTTSVP